MTLSLYTQPYHYNGRDYVIEIHAHDQDDARARLRAAFYQSASNPPQEVVLQVSWEPSGGGQFWDWLRRMGAWFSKMMGVK